MKTTRRGLFAWLGALTGAAAVSRVVPAEAEARPNERPEWMRGWVPFSKRQESEAEARPVYKLLETTAGPVGAGDGYLGTETVTYPLHKAAPPLMCHGYPDELKPHERGEHFCSVCLTHGDRRMYEAQLRKQNERIARVAKANRGTPADFRKQFAPVRLHNEHGLTLEAGGSAFIANPPRTGPVPITNVERAQLRQRLARVIAEHDRRKGEA